MFQNQVWQLGKPHEVSTQTDFLLALEHSAAEQLTTSDTEQSNAQIQELQR